MVRNVVPPDGGWGWIIVWAYATSLICTVSIIQGFGLLFKDTCASIGMSATDISVVISVNSAFGMGLGLINGPLLRYFGYRKIAIAGSLIYGTGLISSGMAKSFVHLIITYGIMCSLGTGIMNSAFSLALNSYFLKKRGRAVGFAMALSGLGPIFVPQIITFLISHYGSRGAISILGAISFHTMVAAFTLQPIAWHQKIITQVSEPEEAPIVTEIPNQDEKSHAKIISTSCEDLETSKRKRTMTMSSIDHDVDTGSIYGYETLTPRKKSTGYAPPGLVTGKVYRRSSSQYDPVPASPTTVDHQEPAYKWWSSGKSLDTINLGSSMKIFDEARNYKPSKSREYSVDGDKDGERIKQNEVQALVMKQIVQTVKEEEDDVEDHVKINDQKNKPEPEETKKEQKSAIRRALHAIELFFDFDLLRDPTYVIIMFGMSIAIFAELNFSLLTPFILSDMELSTDQIATVMSSLAIADLTFRGIVPFVAEWLNQTARNMYLISLSLLVIGRSALLFVEGYKSILIIGLGLGIAKGVRSVFMTLVISNYVPIHKLASASGIQMVTNGLILISIGPLLGVIKDQSGSYDLCIIFMNGLTVFTIVMWTSEMIIRKLMGKPIESNEMSRSKKGRKENK